MAKITLKDRKEKLALILAANLGAVLTADLVETIKGSLGGAGHVSTKVNESGEIFCNYFGIYMPAEAFDRSKKDKLDSMSREGKKLFRTQKAMVNKANAEVLRQFKEKGISADEMAAILGTIEKNAGHRYPAGTESISASYPYEV
jgi:hypothetical protein